MVTETSEARGEGGSAESGALGAPIPGRGFAPRDRFLSDIRRTDARPTLPRRVVPEKCVGDFRRRADRGAKTVAILSVTASVWISALAGAFRLCTGHRARPGSRYSHSSSLLDLRAA